MLNENIRVIRKSKELSQEEMAVRLHVVRQTISKWEQGLSVPDADMLLAISEVLETPVSTLLGETAAEAASDDIKELSEKLEEINWQLAHKRKTGRRFIHWCFIFLCVMIAAVFAFLFILQGSSMEWKYTDPETAVIGTGLHSFEWLFVRIAPFVFVSSMAGAVITRKRI